MEYFPGDTGESTEDIPGRKKSKLKVLKSRLFGRSKRGGGEGDAKLSQSVSDITAEKGLGSVEDLACSQGIMGSRAFSHESIFLADEVLTDAEPARVLSQENVHSKIKALQIKLQQQKMHLGPPPLVLPVRRPEDLGSRSEDDLRCPPEISGALSKTTSQPSSRPLSPIPKPAPTKSPLPLPLTVPSNSSSSVVEPPLDFSSPAQFTPCLDTSAARHRMAVKPRKQRASTKKTLASNDSKSDLHTLNNINHPESVREEEQRLSSQEEVTLEIEQGGAFVPITSQHLPSKSPEEAPITSYSLAVSQQDQALLGSVPSAPSQQIQGETESTRGLKRPTTGSGSFHLSIAKNRDAGRPRSGSFVGELEPTESRHKTGTEDKPFSSMREKEELRGVPFAVGRLRQEGAPHKSSVLWDRRDSLKKVESFWISSSENNRSEANSRILEDSASPAGHGVDQAVPALRC